MNDKNVLSDDKSKNTILTNLSISLNAMTVRMGMWGEAMFGSPLILGAGYSSSYQSAPRKNVILSSLPLSASHKELNVIGN